MSVVFVAKHESTPTWTILGRLHGFEHVSLSSSAHLPLFGKQSRAGQVFGETDPASFSRFPASPQET